MRIDYNHNYYFVIKQYDYFFDILLFSKSKKGFNMLAGEGTFYKDKIDWSWVWSKLGSKKDDILKFAEKIILNMGLI